MALVAALGLIGLACGQGGGRVDLTPGGETPAAGVGQAAGEARPMVARCQGPEFEGFQGIIPDEARDTRPLQPLVFCGRVIIGGEAAPDGTLVQAVAEGKNCGATRTRDDLYWLDLPLFRCPEKLTGELVFLVDGQEGRTLRSFGRAQYVDLFVSVAP